jgi:hypothetical protein
MLFAIRSLTELHGFMLSILAQTFATAPSATGILFSRTSGVFPTMSASPAADTAIGCALVGFVATIVGARRAGAERARAGSGFGAKAEDDRASGARKMTGADAANASVDTIISSAAAVR